MISCLTFRKRLNDFIYGTISGEMKKSFEEHLQNCESCRIIYEDELQIEKAFREAINIRNIKFVSSRDEIIKSIDKNRYSKSFSNKLFYRIRKNFINYAASAVLLISLTAVGLYFYSIYISNPNKETAQNINYNYVEDVKDNQSDTAIKPKIQNLKNTFIETELPLPQSSNNKEIQEILNKIKKQPLGADSWKIGYSDGNKVVFYNYSALLAYAYNDGKPKYYGAVDLEKINAGYMQGAIYTDFNFSPKGDYVIISNSSNENDLQNNKYSMYLYNFKNGELKVISYVNKFLIKDAWSSNSNFYVFGDKNGKEIFIYDLLSSNSITIPFNKGSIKNIFVSDSGDIILESSSNANDQTTIVKYILRKDNSYASEEYFIPGSIIGIKGNKVLYYDQDTVYNLISGKSSIVKKFDPGVNLLELQNRYAVFTDGVYAYLYDYNNNFYKYMSSFNQDYSVEFSPDLKKSALQKLNTTRIMYSEDNQDELDIGYYDDFSSNYSWYGNNSLIRISQKEGSNNFGDFRLYKASILPDATKVSEENKNSTKLNEQYAPGIFVDSPNINSIEKANIILVNYFEHLKSEAVTDSIRIKDYKIKLIRIEKQAENSIMFSVEYSVLPMGNYTPPSGKLKDDKGWYNNIYNYFSVYTKDNIYYIEDIS